MSISASTSSRRRCRFTISRRFRIRVTCGVPGYWAGRRDTGYYCARHLGAAAGTGIAVDARLLGLCTTASMSFTPGYWGPQIGFYGGVAYGFGYDGVGYEGGHPRG